MENIFLGKPSEKIKKFLENETDNPTLKVSMINETQVSGQEKFWISVNGGEEFQGEFDKVYSYQKGIQISIRAVEETVTYFIKWSDENTDNPRNITLNSNTELTAVFHTNYS